MTTNSDDSAFRGTNSLTKREYFANSVYKAILTAHYSVEHSENEIEAPIEAIAAIAVEHADALIKALNKR